MTDSIYIHARKSTVIVGLVFLAIGLWSLYRERAYLAWGLLSFASLVLAAAAVSPKATLKFYRAWMGLAAILGYVNSRILLSLMFYGLLTPYGLILRLLGRDQMARRGRSSDTYWIPRDTSRQRRDQFLRQF